MNKIAILGWGSLVWDPRELKTVGEWMKDGPCLPVEFARISNDDRLTLVLREASKAVPTLWIISSCSSLKEAIRNLADRENMEILDRIGFIDFVNNSRSERNKFAIKAIEEWALNNELDAVIWTDLGIRFRDKIGKNLTLDNIINYLRALDSEALERAKEYILNTPKQVQTEYRMSIMVEMDWK